MSFPPHSASEYTCQPIVSMDTLIAPSLLIVPARVDHRARRPAVMGMVMDMETR